MNILLLLLGISMIVLAYMFRKEGFAATSPGTMVQLRTSHVSTEEDEYYWRHIYPKQIKREIYNMTESDLY